MQVEHGRRTYLRVAAAWCASQALPALPKLGFFMYPAGENAEGRFDSSAPDDFKYQISARELTSS